MDPQTFNAWMSVIHQYWTMFCNSLQPQVQHLAPQMMQAIGNTQLQQQIVNTIATNPQIAGNQQAIQAYVQNVFNQCLNQFASTGVGTYYAPPAPAPMYTPYNQFQQQTNQFFGQRQMMPTQLQASPYARTNQTLQPMPNLSIGKPTVQDEFIKMQPSPAKPAITVNPMQQAVTTVAPAPAPTTKVPVIQQKAKFVSPKDELDRPKFKEHTSVSTRFPVKCHGDIAVYEHSDGSMINTLMVQLEGLTTDPEAELKKLRTKYDYEKIVLMYRDFRIEKANLKEMQDVSIKIKNIYETGKTVNIIDVLKKIIDILDTCTQGVYKQVSTIILDEFNSIATGRNPDDEIANVSKLEDILKIKDKIAQDYLNTAIGVFCKVNIFDPASEDMSPYLQNYEVMPEKSYKDLRRNKDQFTEWASTHIVIVSNDKLLRYTTIQDPALIDLEPGYSVKYENSDIESDFDYFLFDAMKIDSQVEDLIVVTGNIARKYIIVRTEYGDDKSILCNVFVRPA